MHRIDLGRQDLEVLPPFFSLLIELAEYSSREAAAIPAACCLSGVRTQAYCWLAAAYPECELKRIVCWLLPIRSATSGVLFVGLLPIRSANSGVLFVGC